MRGLRQGEEQGGMRKITLPRGRGIRPARARWRPAALALIAVIATLVAPCAVAVDILDLGVNGVHRTARAYPGDMADREPSPLVIVFHGLADSARNFSNIVGFHRQWTEATVVYPEGLPRSDRDGSRGWHGFRDNDENDDLAFVDALLDLASVRYRVDPARVYVTGFSNGGHMTFNLLLDRPCRFAAFAPVGALAEYVAGAATARPTLYLFGREEPREYSEAWQRTVVALAKANHTTGEKREWDFGLTEFVPGPDGATTIYGLYKAGHVWPSSGNEIIVHFFREHRLDGDAGCAPPN
jgi:poly(3-hydroxybutyrate) depolymerase